MKSHEKFERNDSGIEIQYVVDNRSAVVKTCDVTNPYVEFEIVEL